jgi:hypothetical protein
MIRLRRISRYLGMSCLVLFLLSWPLAYVYYRWDDQRVIKAYGGDPKMERQLTPFLGRYFEEHLRGGMSLEEVHKAIREYSKIDVIEKKDGQVVREIIFLDPMQTLAIWVSYEKGQFSPPVNVDRVIGKDLEIQLAILISGAVLLLVSFIPFERWFPSRTSQVS